MRISTNQLYQTGLNALNRQQAELLHTYQQISSGRRMVTPADDPLGAAQLINVSQAKSLNERLAANRNVALQNLSIEESVLNNVTLRFQDIKTRIVEASTGTLSDADRQTLAQVVENLRDNMLALANSTDGNGQYLFSGHQGDRAPYAVNPDGSITWQGDQQKRLIQIDQTRQVSTSDDGYTLFNTAPAGSRAYFTSGDPANTGTGEISTPVIVDPAGPYIGHDYQIEFVGTDYQISVYDKSGTLVDGPTPPAPMNESGQIDLPGGMRVTIAGTPQDGDRFGLTFAQGEDINVFDTLDKLAKALRTPVEGDQVNIANLRNILIEAGQKIDENYNATVTVRASLGARINEIEALDYAGEQRGLSYETEMSRLSSLDLYEATMKLNLHKAGLEAASLAFQQIQRLSLFSTGNK